MDRNILKYLVIVLLIIQFVMEHSNEPLFYHIFGCLPLSEVVDCLEICEVPSVVTVAV